MSKVQIKRVGRGETMTELSYDQLKAIQGFVGALITRKGNIYDRINDELDESLKAFERWSKLMAKELSGEVGGND